ncbi:hypothetical protein VQ056_11000 [Paenibacillus sp. JTLBN-2024]
MQKGVKHEYDRILEPASGRQRKFGACCRGCGDDRHGLPFEIADGAWGMAKERVEGAFPMSAYALDHSLVAFQDHGMDALERLCMNRRLTRENLRDYTLPLLADRLDLVQGERQARRHDAGV